MSKVQKIGAEVGSSQMGEITATAAIYISGSIDLPPKSQPLLSASTTIGATINVSVPVTTRIISYESGPSLRPFLLRYLDLMPSACKYVFSLCFYIIDMH